MLPPSGQLLTESECRNLGLDPGKQDAEARHNALKHYLLKLQSQIQTYVKPMLVY